ncbi:uncharacterized protein [Drosophila tropicalis]|uniref:uncharacterized protein n=1 Tax=Drosophila tropicalis TaxID=46794 RepID=UPI0035ABED5F
MLFIRSRQETWELKAAVLLVVGLFIMNVNVLRMKYPADVQSILVTLSIVMLMHLFRVEKIGPVIRSRQVIVDIVVYYILNQNVIALVWEPFAATLEIFNGQFVKHPKVAKNSLLNFVGHYSVISIKLVVALLLTYKSVKLSRSLEYIFPWRTYIIDPCEMPLRYKSKHINDTINDNSDIDDLDNKKKKTGDRRASKARSRPHKHARAH